MAVSSPTDVGFRMPYRADPERLCAPNFLARIFSLLLADPLNPPYFFLVPIFLLHEIAVSRLVDQGFPRVLPIDPRASFKGLLQGGDSCSFLAHNFCIGRFVLPLLEPFSSLSPDISFLSRASDYPKPPSRSREPLKQLFSRSNSQNNTNFSNYWLSGQSQSPFEEDWLLLIGRVLD